MLSVSHFSQLCTCLQMTVKAAGMSILGSPINFRKQANLQVWNPAIVRVDAVKRGLLFIKVEIRKMRWSSGSSRGNAGAGRIGLEMCLHLQL